MNITMYGKTSWVSVIGLVFLISAIVHCEELEGLPPVATYVTPLERGLRAITKPIEILDNTLHNIGSGIKNAWSSIRGKKNLDEKKEKQSNRLGETLNKYRDRIRAIYPGTRWCGDGDIAENDDDLGLFSRTDACCRAHDKCPSGITAGEQKFGLLNNGIFTRSHCDCDDAFYQCLKEARSLLATKIGTTYFNILRPQCFEKAHPIKSCKTYAKNRLIDDKCLKYDYDETAPEKYQWRDSPDFFNL